jgi:hypothetical protein
MITAEQVYHKGAIELLMGLPGSASSLGGF